MAVTQGVRTVTLSQTAPAGANSQERTGAAYTHPQASWAGPQYPYRVTRVELILPAGSRGDLHLRPVAEGPDGDWEDLVAYGDTGDRYLWGDRVHVVMLADKPVRGGWTLRVRYDATACTYSHRFLALVTIEPGSGVG